MKVIYVHKWKEMEMEVGRSGTSVRLVGARDSLDDGVAGGPSDGEWVRVMMAVGCPRQQ